MVYLRRAGGVCWIGILPTNYFHFVSTFVALLAQRHRHVGYRSDCAIYCNHLSWRLSRLFFPMCRYCCITSGRLLRPVYINVKTHRAAVADVQRDVVLYWRSVRLFLVFPVMFGFMSRILPEGVTYAPIFHATSMWYWVCLCLSDLPLKFQQPRCCWY